MEFLGIGPLELAFILLIVLLVIGPKDLEKTARALGRGLNSIVKSDLFRTVQQVGRELQNLPTELMREANLEESQKDLQQIGKDLQQSLDIGAQRDTAIKSAWTPDAAGPTLNSPPPPSIAPPPASTGGSQTRPNTPPTDA
jgi:Sec-independent protein translocase protein TatA